MLHGQKARAALAACGVEEENITDKHSRFDHAECGDTRSRLYVKREGETILGWCHNCSTGYHYTTRKWLGTAISASFPVTSAAATVLENRYLRASSNMDYWPVEALQRLEEYECLEEDFIHRYNYRADELGLYYKHGGNIVRRNTSGAGTRYNMVRGKFPPLYMGTFLPSTLYICEDGLSSQKLNYYAKRTTCALLGTSLPSSLGEWVANLKASGITSCIVWLDPDDAGRKAAWRIMKELTPLIATHCHYDVCEPKDKYKLTLESWV